mgnify:CR=1 FL=1
MTSIMTGSSPHVRGALGETPVGRMAPGIIPACAGSTRRRLSVSMSSRDHPRMCGEHLSGTGTGTGHEGSSPHVRGAPRIATGARMACGIIPACAGSTPEPLKSPPK